MGPLGTPPPTGLADDRAAVASWYWDAVEEAHGDCEAHHEGHEPLDCPAIADLCTGAIFAGVTGHLVTISNYPTPVQLSELLAPYRTRPGGLAETLRAEADRVLREPYRRRHAKWYVGSGVMSVADL